MTDNVRNFFNYFLGLMRDLKSDSAVKKVVLKDISFDKNLNLHIKTNAYYLDDDTRLALDQLYIYSPEYKEGILPIETIKEEINYYFEDNNMDESQDDFLAQLNLDPFKTNDEYAFFGYFESDPYCNPIEDWNWTIIMFTFVRTGIITAEELTDMMKQYGISHA